MRSLDRFFAPVLVLQGDCVMFRVATQLLSSLTVLAVLVCSATAEPADGTLQLQARSRAALDDGTFQVQVEQLQWDPHKTAIVVCDMWDRHWCRTATERVGQMAPRMNDVIGRARQQGVLIIHCPSGCMDKYADTPQRRLAQQAPQVDTKIPLQGWCHLDAQREAPLPIDDSDGGCDTDPPCRTHRAWTQQIDTIEIHEADAITDSAEAYYLMRQRGIENVIVMGVHTNMCVLGRPFSIRQMVYQGQNVVLMRDMTDSMYNPKLRPQVSHFRGTELVIEHIEKHWCPSVCSDELLKVHPPK